MYRTIFLVIYKHSQLINCTQLRVIFVFFFINTYVKGRQVIFFTFRTFGQYHAHYLVAKLTFNNYAEQAIHLYKVISIYIKKNKSISINNAADVHRSKYLKQTRALYYCTLFFFRSPSNRDPFFCRFFLNLNSLQTLRLKSS